MVLVSEVMTETREATPSHFLLKIESFSLLLTHGIPQVETSDFAAGGYKWKLIIGLNNEKTKKDLNDEKTGNYRSDYISVKLAVSNISSLPANWDVDATFSIFLFNHISCNYVYSQGRTRRFLGIKSEWGFPEFISKEALMDPSNGYLMNDNCAFGAEVFVLGKSTIHKCLCLKDVSVPYKHRINISKFSEIKDNLWTSEQFTVGGQKWYVKLYPKGTGDGEGQYVSMFLCYAGRKRVMASYKICLRNQITDMKELTTDTYYKWFAEASRGWGSIKFINVSCLKDPGKGFLKNDCLMLEIEMSVLAVIE